MSEPGNQKPTLVPFPRIFAVLGFALFCAVAILVLLETGSWVVYHFARYRISPLHRLQAGAPPNTYPCRGTGNGKCSIFGDAYLNSTSASPTYDPYPWAEEFWREYRAYTPNFDIPPYEPFRLWGMAKFQSQYINVDDTPTGRIRRTINKPQPGCDEKTAVKIWTFGGSTMWGSSTPDFATIPSYLSEKLNAQGKACVEVINLGVDAYDSNQELIYMMEQLKAGWRPNLVIFYDGVNDTIVDPFESIAAPTHLYYPQIKAKFESPIISWPGLAYRSNFVMLVTGIGHRLGRARLPQGPQPKWDTLATLTMDNWENNLRMARAMGKDYGFEVYGFWQPTLLYGNKPQDTFEKMTAGEYAGAADGYQAVYKEAERRAAASDGFVFLGRIFDSVSEPLYLDWSHIGPHGNEMVAEAMARTISTSGLFHRQETSPRH